MQKNITKKIPFFLLIYSLIILILPNIYCQRRKYIIKYYKIIYDTADTESEREKANTPLTMEDFETENKIQVIALPKLEEEITESERKKHPHYKVFYENNGRIATVEELLPDLETESTEQDNYRLVARYFYKSEKEIARKEYYKYRNGIDVLYRVDYYKNNILRSTDYLDFSPAFFYSNIYYRDENTKLIIKEEIYSKENAYMPALLEFRIYYNIKQGSVVVDSFSKFGKFVSRKHFDYDKFENLYSEILFSKRTKINVYYRRHYNIDNLLKKEEVFDENLNLKYYYIFYYNEKGEQIKYEYYDKNGFLEKIVEKADNGFWLPTYVGKSQISK